MTKLAPPIIDSLGREAISRRLGVTEHSVRHARVSGTFPASWYAPLLEMCAEKGVECPIEAFNFRTASPEHEEGTAA